MDRGGPGAGDGSTIVGTWLGRGGGAALPHAASAMTASAVRILACAAMPEGLARAAVRGPAITRVRLVGAARSCWASPDRRAQRDDARARCGPK